MMGDLPIDPYLATLHSVRRENVEVLFKKEKGYGRNVIVENRQVSVAWKHLLIQNCIRNEFALKADIVYLTY